MRFIDEVVENSMDIWKAYLDTPFVLEMANGTLSIDSFKEYIIQDTLYLREYARVFALAMYKSTSSVDIKDFYEVLGFVNDTEANTRIKYLNNFGINPLDVDKMELKKENKDYTDFMLEVAVNGDVPEILMAVLPCMLSYAYIGKEIIKNTSNVYESRYFDMINDYTNESYINSCQHWSDFAENKCANLPKSRKAELSNIFREASVHEMNFWNMCYIK